MGVYPAALTGTLVGATVGVGIGVGSSVQPSSWMGSACPEPAKSEVSPEVPDCSVPGDKPSPYHGSSSAAPRGTEPRALTLSDGADPPAVSGWVSLPLKPAPNATDTITIPRMAPSRSFRR